MQPKAKDKREIEAILQDAMAQAVDFVESEITDQRIKAQRYFDGEVDIGYEDGRSKVVATKVRDTIRSVKPSIMRVFMSTAKPVEFLPKGGTHRHRTVGPFETHALPGKAVDVRGLAVRIPVAPPGITVHVVGQEEDEVRFLGGTQPPGQHKQQAA